MKKILAALLLLASGFAAAQTWYYNVDQDNRLDPDKLNFSPTPEDMLCASLLSPGSTPAGGASVSNLTLPASCPSSPPVVVWGVDPSTGDTVYATLLVVKFWGKRRASNSTYGTEALIRLLKRSYAYTVKASGDLNEADSQFLPPFTTPPINSPVNTTSGWHHWQSSQDLSLADPEVSDVQNHSRWNSTCRRLYGSRCWSAVFTWALPVRLVVHGGEKGSYQIQLTPDIFVEKGAGTLSVSGGSFVEQKVVPAPR